MARKRPGFVATRRVVAGMAIFLGVFVLCFGLGNGSRAIMLVGVALIIAAFTSRLVVLLRTSARQWVVGVGQIVHVSDPPSDVPYGRCDLQLVVQALDLPEETVIVREPRMPVEQWPRVGQQVRIEVAADDVRNVRILWDEPPERPEILVGDAADPPGPPADDDQPLWDAILDDDQPDPVPAEPPPSHLDLDDDDVDIALDGPSTLRTGPAEASPADEGRPGRHVTLISDPSSQRVPRPRPRPRPRPQPQPAPEPDVEAAYPSAHPGPSGAIHRIGVTLLVRDLAASVRFYRDTLGFHEVDHGEEIAVLASGDTRLVLYASKEMKPVNRRVTHLNLDVADIDALYADLRAAGVRFTYGPRQVSRGLRIEQWAAAFRDPDGHGIALTQWRSRDD